MGILYIKNAETGAFVPISSIQGATGPKGQKGATGPQGPTGATGPQGASGRGVSDIAWDSANNKWVVTYTDNTTQDIDGPDLSGYMRQRIVTSEPADADIAEGEIVWIGEVVT